jgi:hypothetical protein
MVEVYDDDDDDDDHNYDSNDNNFCATVFVIRIMKYMVTTSFMRT